MAPQTLLGTLAAIRVAPLEHLTSRRLRSLATFLSGRDLALASFGVVGWNDLPIEKLVEDHYGVATMPWRNWIDIVEYFAADEWAAFDDFLALAATWTEPAVEAPILEAPKYSFDDLLGRIAQRPEMHLGEPTLAGLEDLVSGYIKTAEAFEKNTDPDITAFRNLCASIRSESGGRPWFKVLRFNVSSDEEAMTAFFERWRRA